MYYVFWICTIYVFGKLIWKLYKLADVYLLPSFRQPFDFMQYGPWAVVTGSTDGIGKEFALQLAEKGLNICLISRSAEKLKATAEEIERKHGVNTKCITSDFADPNIYEEINSHIADLDVGILVNNVGMEGTNEPFSRQTQSLIKSMVGVNILSVLLMTSLLLQKMIPKKKGLIVNISSIAGEFAVPHYSLYAATKSCVTQFGACLNTEANKHNVIIKTITPGYVSTKMVNQHAEIRKFANSLPYNFPNVDDYVKSTLKTFISSASKCCGYFPHELLLTVIKLIPDEIVLSSNRLFRKSLQNKSK